jgi:lipoprotein-anchoring transpeptidase ErfK/SrfK
MNKRVVGLWAVLLAGAAILSGCTSGGPTKDRAGDTSGTAAGTASAAPAKVEVTPADGTTKARPDRAVKVTVSDGTLQSVEVTTKQGTAVQGAVSTDQRAWTSAGTLSPGTTYQVKVRSSGQGGASTETSSSFSTLSPKTTASVSIQPRDGWTVGVGMPVIIDFGRSVATANRPAVEKGLKVSTTNAIEGDWRWFSAKQVQWRPRVYWPAHTAVSVSARLSAVELAPGVWGSSREHTASFTVGPSMISTVDVRKHTLTVRRDGKVARVIPVTTGKPGFASRNGIKLIMSRETSRQMDAATTGTDVGDPEYYNLKVKYAMRLTYSGEFLHQAEWSVGSQGRANVSHGCTGMSPANAKWLFSQSHVGDVVIFKGSKRPLEWGNGYTAWDMSYSQWKSA